ncbi:hypothetical protein SLEP1_g5976 [Rubroshorea leprosula]|uniref:Uncharacterized protein n=1 Tax=Rubroshorea leprosula TaxID=152421 RepID=A0AAV5HZY2_9ROSI|nr:hypothetical protein SLEP1_g5976 [Rubroshorea leprosula]
MEPKNKSEFKPLLSDCSSSKPDLKHSSLSSCCVLLFSPKTRSARSPGGRRLR